MDTVDIDDDTVVQQSKAMPEPILPSKTMVDAHNLTHWPYRSWCPVCVQGRGREYQHRRIRTASHHIRSPYAFRSQCRYLALSSTSPIRFPYLYRPVPCFRNATHGHRTSQEARRCCRGTAQEAMATAHPRLRGRMRWCWRGCVSYARGSGVDACLMHGAQWSCWVGGVAHRRQHT